MKKRAFSLIEIIVCLGLLSVLLSTLFYWYYSFSKQKEMFNHLKNPLMEERYAHQRLQYVLPTAELPFFSISNEGFVFIFDRGPHTLPELSGKVLGRIYYDRATQCLCLGIWPKPDKKDPLRYPSESFVLLDGINECKFEFYHPPDLFKKPVDPEEVGKPRPDVGWQNEWKTAYQKLPALVRILIERDPAKGLEKHSFYYHFDLPVTIIYPKEAT